MRKLGWVVLAWVSVVGLLGGLTVKLLTPPPVSVLHTCLAQLFFSLTVAMCLFTSKSWMDGPEMVDDHGWPSMRSLAIIVPVVVLTQIALGAGFRHGALGVMPHLVGAMVVIMVLLMYWSVRDAAVSHAPHAAPGGDRADDHRIRAGVAGYPGADCCAWLPTQPTTQVVIVTVAHVAGRRDDARFEHRAFDSDP